VPTVLDQGTGGRVTNTSQQTEYGRNSSSRYNEAKRQTKDCRLMSKSHMNFDALREDMVQNQLMPRHINDARVLQAMRRVPRHEFVPPEVQPEAYRDGPLPIGCDQTISQPYIVALMTQLLGLRGDEIVLEIGTGSGYQTAVLCELAAQVFSIERHRSLAEIAWNRLKSLGYTNAQVGVGDGTRGLPDEAPFDAILVAATGPAIPGPLRAQMSPNAGRMVLPVGVNEDQHLLRVWRDGDTWNVEKILRVRFVPLLGRFGFFSED
jgi:protein-L-isoaspartate(D-aspartate) O-methyltransferase